MNRPDEPPDSVHAYMRRQVRWAVPMWLILVAGIATVLITRHGPVYWIANGITGCVGALLLGTVVRAMRRLNEARVDVVFADGTHWYRSTLCRHKRHKECAATELAPGLPRRPAQCKTCASPCLCGCHTNQPSGDLQS
jgi:hypothetical protein